MAENVIPRDDPRTVVGKKIIDQLNELAETEGPSAVLDVLANVSGNFILTYEANPIQFSCNVTRVMEHLISERN